MVLLVLLWLKQVELLGGEVFTVPHINPLDSTGFLWTPVDSKSNLFV